MKNKLISLIHDRALRDKNIIILTGDLGFGVLDSCQKDLPNQFINCGIAEQNMMSVAAGLGMNGKTVFVYSIGNFSTLRCLEQIRNDCCYHGANVKIICVGGGMSYGALGMSHHATEDIAIMRALPDVRVYTPANGVDIENCFEEIMQDGVCYIRLGKGGEKNCYPQDYSNTSSSPVEVAIGEDIVVISVGAIIEEACEAREALSQMGIQLGIVNVPKIKPLDEQTLLGIIDRYNNIITLEEHNVCGGLSSIVMELIAKNKRVKNIAQLCLKDCYPSIIGSQKYLRQQYQFDANAIVSCVKEMLK